MIGPKHYEGWTCHDCEFLRHDFDGMAFSYCDNPIVVMVECSQVSVDHTPNWCPYLKTAIIENVLENF